MTISKEVRYGLLLAVLLISIGLIISLFALLGFLNPGLFLAIISTMYHMLIWPLTFPITGISYLLAKTGLYLYLNHIEKEKSLAQKTSEALFISGNFILSLTGYSLWIATMGVMTPWISGILLSTYILEVIKESYHLQRELRAYQHLQKDVYDEQHIRALYICRKHKHTAIIKAIGALVFLSIVIGLNFLPPNVLLSISITSLMFSLFLVQRLIIQINNKIQMRGLEEQLRSLKIEAAKNIPESQPENTCMRTQSLTDIHKLMSQESIPNYSAFFAPKRPDTVSDAVQTKDNGFYI